MTSHFAYIGYADDPNFHWEHPPDERFRTGHLPRRLLPEKSYDSLPVSVFYVMQLIEERRYEGRQVDWGAWALKLTGQQLWEFLEPMRESIGVGTWTTITALEAAKPYLLVVAESP